MRSFEYSVWSETTLVWMNKVRAVISYRKALFDFISRYTVKDMRHMYQRSRLSPTPFSASLLGIYIYES